jgi:hypothetical protein
LFAKSIQFHFADLKADEVLKLAEAIDHSLRTKRSLFLNTGVELDTHALEKLVDFVVDFLVGVDGLICALSIGTLL